MMDVSKLIIRKESPADIPGIHRVAEEAFKRPGEANLVDALRSAQALTLSIVATINDSVVGHLAVSPVVIESSSSTFPAQAFGPVCVAPSFQGQGIGSALIRWSFEECRQVGHHVVTVLGNSGYYSRFGFVSAPEHGIEGPFPVHPPGAFMVIELEPEALEGCSGTIKYHSAFGLV